MSPADFSEEVDSIILVRERVRGSNLEGAYKKKKGKIIGEASPTISILPKKGKTVIYSKRDVALQRSKLTKSPQSDKKPKQAKVPSQKRATIAPDSSSSEEMGAPGCSWWLDNNEQSGKAEKQAEHAHRQNTAILESAHEETKTSPVKANVEWEISHKNPTTQKSARKTKKPKSPQSDKKPKQTKVPSQKRATIAPDSSSSVEMGARGCSWWPDNNEQSGKAEKQAEHAHRQNTAILESAHEETKTSPVKANVEWEISHKNPTTQKSARKTKKPKSPQSDKKPKQTKVPSQKRATIAPDSSSSEEMGAPGCSWWPDNNEQNGKAEKQAEHAHRQNTAIPESAHEETKTSPVKANVEWEISHKNTTTRKSARKTKKPDWFGHNFMKTIDRDVVAEEK